MDEAFSWPGVLAPSMLEDSVVAAAHRLADAAKAGDWGTVMSMIVSDSQAVNVNQWRPGGGSWFTVLHQAAWHGAPIEIVAALTERGALRTLRDAKGRTAHDIAADHGRRTSLIDSLAPPPSPLTPECIRALNVHLATVIDRRIHDEHIDQGYANRDLRKVLRYPPVDVLHELPSQSVWFPVPGMYGGFHITLREHHLYVESWIRVVGGSGQAHVVTREGPVLVNQGFA